MTTVTHYTNPDDVQVLPIDAGSHPLDWVWRLDGRRWTRQGIDTYPRSEAQEIARRDMANGLEAAIAPYSKGGDRYVPMVSFDRPVP